LGQVCESSPQAGSQKKSPHWHDVEQSAEQETMFSPQAALQLPSPHTQLAPQSAAQVAEFSPQEATH
jgi:hypothetical protein